ncbi:molecular chaperone [Stylonychia lemnae]|uniref:Molecular chaperone n=1 Tax=Stylonychia lemnae TaxID=5949 RepID=A0A078AMP2_STYLE|nr:molecular chaperone [Stylonychia lemnae]|eukprot:CDW82138.1 molecular chaperone [Stylonychia lemnae]
MLQNIRYFSAVPKIEKCLYKTLGVGRDANNQEIKESYLKLARVYHPDKMPEALEYFTQVTKAYEILNDPLKRAVYDDESITDEEFFTIQIGPLKVNLFSVFMQIKLLTYFFHRIALFGSTGYFAYYYLIVKRKDDGKCPIDIKEYKSI